MREFCLANVGRDERIVSPCLRPKGHKGKHKHVGLCKSVSCMCHWNDERGKRLGNTKLYNKDITNLSVDLSWLEGVVEELKFRIPLHEWKVPAELASGQVVVPLHELLSAVRAKAEEEK